MFASRLMLSLFLAVFGVLGGPYAHGYTIDLSTHGTGSSLFMQGTENETVSTFFGNVDSQYGILHSLLPRTLNFDATGRAVQQTHVIALRTGGNDNSYPAPPPESKVMLTLFELNGVQVEVSQIVTLERLFNSQYQLSVSESQLYNAYVPNIGIVSIRSLVSLGQENANNNNGVGTDISSGMLLWTEFSVSPVPEAQSFSMLTLGLAALALRHNRKRSSNVLTL